MGFWPPASPGAKIDAYGQSRSNTYAVGLTNTTDYVEVTSATSRDAAALIITGQNPATSTSMASLYRGAASSEQIIVPQLYYGNVFGYGYNAVIPIFVPAGTRLSAKADDVSVAMTVHAISRQFYSGPTYAGMDAYGAGTGTGVSIDPGGSSNTKGSWTEITSGTTHHLKAFAFAIGSGGNSTMTPAGWLMDLAIGGSGSETTIIENYNLHASSAADGILPMWNGPFACNIPTGTRIAARAQSNTTDATDRLFQIVVYGFY